MIDGPGRDDVNPVGRVVAGEVAADIVGREAHHSFRCAEDRPANHLVVIGSACEIVENHVIRDVAGRADLLQDDVFLACEFLFIEGRTCEDIGQNINGKRQMILQNSRVIRGRFGRGGGIDLSADIFDLFRDLTRCPTLGSLEGHVFQKVCNAMLVLELIA
nr:hypothetical protein [Marinicella sp. W31]MDC2877726.1 hypothetical protein [Marinicella sp. W31]